MIKGAWLRSSRKARIALGIPDRTPPSLGRWHGLKTGETQAQILLAAA
jgi:hypothetical protein